MTAAREKDRVWAITKRFAESVKRKFEVPATFNPEDQLKDPVAILIKEMGAILGFKVDTVTEVQVSAVSGRPDMGVAIGSLLSGHVELKATGKGADPRRFKEPDRNQWQRFKDLPNLVYTDGNEWGLYRSGQLIGSLVKLHGSVELDGASKIPETDANLLFEMIRDFLHWEPIVPSTAKSLAKMLAPICRLLRRTVEDTIKVPSSNLSTLAADWRRYLFPDADDGEFADAYAQTLTYALLLARLSMTGKFQVSDAAKTLKPSHRLLSETMKILGDEKARDELDVPIGLLERVIAAIDPAAVADDGRGDPWLYFYEDFLAEYDPAMRKDRGVYYTPVPVVQTQVRLVSELLVHKFKAMNSFVDEKVVTLDPACGTGTYVLAAIDHGLRQLRRRGGVGIKSSAATTAAHNIHAFEILVGPYAVANLRLTQQLKSEGGSLPDDGVHVYLTDTLESPHAVPPQLPLLYQPLGLEHERALNVKAKTPVFVCIGNPPYDRQQIETTRRGSVRRKGGWVRYGDGDETKATLYDFIQPLAAAGLV